MIAITGANGNLGRATIEFLLQKVPPAHIVAIVRDAATVNDFKQLGVVVRKADYNDYASVKQAFKDVERALQISTIGVSIAKAKIQEENVVKAMAANKVKHIVYTSIVQASPHRIFHGTAVQYHTEELIKKTTIAYTFFRNSMYMEAIPELIGNALQTNQIRYPSGNGKVSFVSRREIAEAIAKVLTEPKHENKTYEITGNHAHTFEELAKLLHDKMRHMDIDREEFQDELNNLQLPQEVVNLLVSMADAIKADEFSLVENTLEKLIGRESTSLEAYLSIYKNVI